MYWVKEIDENKQKQPQKVKSEQRRFEKNYNLLKKI